MSKYIVLLLPLISYALYLIRDVLVIFGYVLVVVLFIALCILLWWIIEKMLVIRAGRIEQEKQAGVMIIDTADGTWVFDHKSRAIQALHLQRSVLAGVAPTEGEKFAWHTFHGPKSVKALQALPVPAIEQAPVNLLAALDGVQRCLIVGASDSGKTTLLQHLIQRKLLSSQVVVIDPHSYPDKYPSGCEVVGQGRSYPDIAKMLDNLIKIMTERYDEIGRGAIPEMGHQKLTIVIDEWRAIVGNIGRSAGEAIKALLTESRKAAFSVFLATHSDRAKPLGLQGEYDLKDGFAIVKLAVVDGKRQATFRVGNSEVVANLPGPYRGLKNQVVALPVREMSQAEQVEQAIEDGISTTRICDNILGGKNGDRWKLVNTIRAGMKVKI